MFGDICLLIRRLFALRRLPSSARRNIFILADYYVSLADFRWQCSLVLSDDAYVLMEVVTSDGDRRQRESRISLAHGRSFLEWLCQRVEDVGSQIYRNPAIRDGDEFSFFAWNDDRQWPCSIYIRGTDAIPGISRFIDDLRKKVAEYLVP